LLVSLQNVVHRGDTLKSGLTYHLKERESKVDVTLNLVCRTLANTKVKKGAKGVVRHSLEELMLKRA
jgi:predicted Zn-dependent peptidase